MELLAQAAQAPEAAGDTAEIVLFWVFAVLAIGSGLAVVTLRNIVHGALMLVVNLLGVAGLYLALESPFLAIIQVLVYGGAIMVLFLFVIMLIGVDRDDLLQVTSRGTSVLAIAGMGLLAGALLFGFVGPYTTDASICGPGDRSAASSDAVPCAGLQERLDAEEQDSVSFVGLRMFTRYTYPFELAALLLTVATIGATVMGRRKDPAPEDPVVVTPAAPSDPGPRPAPVGADSLDTVEDERDDTEAVLGDDREA